jgi:hypothetical protein
MSEHLRKLFYLTPSVVMIVFIGSFSTVFGETRQGHVHQMAHCVMPFDISKTVHIFNRWFGAQLSEHGADARSE